MQRFNILLFSLFLFSFACSAISISGTVTGSRKQNLPDVIVVMTSADNLHVLRNTFTDSEGFYRLDYSGEEDSLKIQLMGFNIVKQSWMISAQTQQLNIQAMEKDIRIQEVVIHTKQIWRSRDTVNYLVARFTRYEDQILGDVLRRLPYIKVVGNGTVLYLDKPINRFSIDDLDLQRDRFGLATSLLKPQDVFIIQVFKKRSVVKKRHLVQIAINLKMK
jgi:hypothetical protein